MPSCRELRLLDRDLPLEIMPTSRPDESWSRQLASHSVGQLSTKVSIGSFSFADASDLRMNLLR